MMAYFVRRIVGTISQELETNRYAIPAISELNQAECSANWPSASRAWQVTIKQAGRQHEPEQRIVTLDHEDFKLY